MAGIIEVKDQGVLRIYDADNSNYVDIVVPSTVSSNRTITIPDASFTIPTTNTVYTHPNHSGEVTSTADGATVIADNIVDEANLKVSNSPTNGYMLTAQSGNTGGLTWAEAGGGKVLQVVQGVLNAEQATTATTMTATSLNVDITPSSSSSKILVILSAPVYMNSGGVYYRGTIYRDSTNLSSNGNMASTRNNGSSIGCSFSINVLDTPSSTSQLTYKYYHRIDSGSGATGYVSINDWTSTIIALEIGA